MDQTPDEPVARGRGLSAAVARGRGLPAPVARGRGLPAPVARRRGLSAPLALPAGFGALLITGAAAAATHGAVSAGWVLALAAGIVAVGSAIAEPAVAPLLGGIGWLTVAGFSRPPYAQLHFTGGGGLRAGLIIAACTAGGAACGAMVRRVAAGFTLWIVDVSAEGQPAGQDTAGQVTGRRRRRIADLSGVLGVRRVVAAVVLLAGGLPLLTVILSAPGLHLDLGDDLLIYLVAVVAVAVVGGFWPAVLAAIAASLLVNWYFTPPVHTLTIADGKSLLALLLFVTVAVTVSSVVHLAALRARQAARSSEEAQDLLALAQTVLGGEDTPAAVLRHLTQSRGGSAELLEQVSGQWVRVAASGPVDVPPAGPVLRAAARSDLVLEVADQERPLSPRLLDGLTAQVAAALDRDRLRTQAAQAEALAEGNRMRTALLAAVSHDLRTPLASIKASVSTLRQTDVEWTEADEAALLATIEQSADRLDALIGNLLDMSRLTTGALQPFLRPTAIDEVAPVALRGLDGGTDLQMRVPDGLPLVLTDPGLLERVLANLFANALGYSPPGRPPELRASEHDGGVLLEIVDHGRGVPDELKEQMFEPFRRLDARGADPSGGTGVGLGLAVVKGFLDTIGGAVHPVNTAGGGLTMRVLLPCAASAASSSAAVPASS
jgi:two-component system sensor histidine kinase KdpD